MMSLNIKKKKKSGIESEIFQCMHCSLQQDTVQMLLLQMMLNGISKRIFMILHSIFPLLSFSVLLCFVLYSSDRFPG